MAEWSKATDSSSVLFGGVGSNPTSGSMQLLFFFFFFCVSIYTFTHQKKSYITVNTTPVRIEIKRIETNKVRFC